MTKSETPDVSVIIPAFNRSRYLAESVDSILSQRWQGTLEILCVDDGSTTDPYSEMPTPLPPQIRLLRKPHEGIGASRQFALQRARGTYIAFNDDDDLWVPDSLAMRMSALEDFPELDMVFSDVREFTEAGDAIQPRNHGRGEFNQVPGRLLRKGEHRLYAYDRNSLIGTFMEGSAMFFQSVLVRREFLRRIGDLDPRTRSAADCLDLELRATYGGVIGYLDEATFRLRRGHQHVTASTDWLDREISEFMEIEPGYPAQLRQLVSPWLGRYLSSKGYIAFTRRDYAAAAEAYRHASRFGSISMKARVRWMIAALVNHLR